MRSRAVALLVPALACVGSSCNHVPATEVIVEIDAEMGIRTRATSLVLVVYDDERDRTEQTVDVGPTGVSWPVSLALVPLDGDAARTYEVEARVTSADGTVIGEQHLHGGYREHEILRPRMFFTTTCEPVSCNWGETCIDGTCQSACSDAGTPLPPPCAPCTRDAQCPGRSCDMGTCAYLQSCAALLAAGVSADGVYAIDPDGAGAEPPSMHWCDQTRDGGGWTLALRGDGTRDTFAYDQEIWTDGSTLNEHEPAIDATSDAKLAAFDHLAFTQIRVGLGPPDDPRYVVLPIAGTSLGELFRGATVPSSLGQGAWLGLLDDAAVQRVCFQEGINIWPSAGCCARVRVGLVADDNDGCENADSWIGIGAAGEVRLTQCGVGPEALTPPIGNYSECGGDDRFTPSMGYLFVR